jgi:hypothetical protein
VGECEERRVGGGEQGLGGGLRGEELEVKGAEGGREREAVKVVLLIFCLGL